MKKLILLILLSVCVAFQASAFDTVVVVGGGGVSACVGNQGGNTDESGDSTGASSDLYCAPFTHSGTCSVDYIEAYIDDNISSNFVLGVYDDDGGAPGAPQTKLAQTSEQSSVAGWGWRGAALGSTVTLMNGETYWLCFHGDNTVGYSYDAGAGSRQAVAYSSTMPATYAETGTTARLATIRAKNQ